MNGWQCLETISADVEVEVSFLRFCDGFDNLRGSQGAGVLSGRVQEKWRMYGRLITTAMLWLTVTGVGAGERLFENSDFEQVTLKNWTAEGEAFERGPTTGAVVPKSDTTGSMSDERRDNWRNTPQFYRQPELAGFEGRAFANSYHPERLDKTTGKLTSRSFVIRNNYISFQLASGQEPRGGVLAVNLVVDGRAVRQATPKGEKFERCYFDVRELKGKEAQVEIVDQETLFGGWIAVASIRGEEKPGGDWIVGRSNEVVRKVAVRRKIDCSRKYLNIPAVGAFPDDSVKLIVDGRVVQEICMAVADGRRVDFWQFIDLSLWRGKEATLTMNGWSRSDDPLAGVVLDDRIRGWTICLTRSIVRSFISRLYRAGTTM